MAITGPPPGGPWCIASTETNTAGSPMAAAATPPTAALKCRWWCTSESSSMIWLRPRRRAVGSASHLMKQLTRRPPRSAARAAARANRVRRCGSRHRCRRCPARPASRCGRCGSARRRRPCCRTARSAPSRARRPEEHEATDEYRSSRSANISARRHGDLAQASAMPRPVVPLDRPIDSSDFGQNAA